MIRAEKENFPVTILCSVLRVSRSGYYAWCKRPSSLRCLLDKRIAVDIAVAHKAGRGTYGTRRIHRVLKNKGWHVSHKRVARLQKQEGHMVKQKRRFTATTDSRHDGSTAQNLLGRSFHISKLNTVWVTDIT